MTGLYDEQFHLNLDMKIPGWEKVSTSRLTPKQNNNNLTSIKLLKADINLCIQLQYVYANTVVALNILK